MIIQFMQNKYVVGFFFAASFIAYLKGVNNSSKETLDVGNMLAVGLRTRRNKENNYNIKIAFYEF